MIKFPVFQRVPANPYVVLTLILSYGFFIACVNVKELNSAKSTSVKPNIIFIMTDDHAYQAVGAYGSILMKTPGIDRIAKEGMRFDKAFVTNSICSPSRAVALTGKFSHLN